MGRMCGCVKRMMGLKTRYGFALKFRSLSRGGQELQSVKPVFNNLQSTRYMHRVPEFGRVLHVAHHEWHGIRNATSYCPGHKLLIAADHPLDPMDLESIDHWIDQHNIERVVFQGYSENADLLALHLKAKFGSGLRCYAIAHVNTAQFGNSFEIDMQARLLMRLNLGVLSGIASVKPNFGIVFEDYWTSLILNFAPNVPPGGYIHSTNTVDVYAPLDVGWRKNMYTNIIAALIAENIDLVKSANYPRGLESLVSLERFRLTGYLNRKELLSEMANSTVVLLATLAECQPMTQLEAFSVGTPAVTGPLFLEEFADDPIIRLCTTDKLDDPALLAKDLERIVDLRQRDPVEMRGQIADHLQRRHQLATERYASFLEM